MVDMIRTVVAVVVAGLLLPLAGCTGASEDEQNVAGKSRLQGRAPTTYTEIKAAAYDQIKALMEGVPCQVPNVGAATSANLKDLGVIKPEGAGTNSLDTRGDIMVAVRNGGGGRIAVFNVSDPLQPEFYADTPLAKGYGDVKLSTDNITIIGGSGQTIDLFDIRNPFEPVHMSTWNFASVPQVGNPTGPAPARPNQNAHMVYTAFIKGEHWVFVAPNSNTGVWILKMKGPEDHRELEFVATTLPVEGGPLGPHDMWVTYDQDAKKWLLYSADGYHGWAVFDVSDPAKPAYAGGIIRPETGYTHTIQAEKIGGKRIVATIAEVGLNLLEVYDATNLMAPVFLGAWHVAEMNPTNPQPASPQHEFNIIGGKIYLGHYSNGAYVFDLTKVTMPVAGTNELKPIAHYSVGTPGPADLFSAVWSVDVTNGVLYVSHMSKGVQVVGFGCLTPGDTAQTTTG